jgi:hypothetical protein
MDLGSKNAVLQTFVLVDQVFNWTPDPPAIKIAYTGTTPGSPLRLLISDMIAYGASSHETWTKTFKDYPHEALVYAIQVLATLWDNLTVRPYRTGLDKYLGKEEAEIR